MLACGGVGVPTVIVGTQSWGWPILQALVEAALLLPVVAYILMRLWFFLAPKLNCRPSPDGTNWSLV
jgi:hypothetical protein